MIELSDDDIHILRELRKTGGSADVDALRLGVLAHGKIDEAMFQASLHGLVDRGELRFEDGRNVATRRGGVRRIDQSSRLVEAALKDKVAELNALIAAAHVHGVAVKVGAADHPGQPWPSLALG